PCMSRIFLPCLTIFALFAFTFAADGQDLKDRRALDKIEAQKLTAAVNDALDASRKQDPRDAKADLREVLNRVRDSSVLMPTERATLVQRLNARIGVLDNAIRDRA